MVVQRVVTPPLSSTVSSILTPSTHGSVARPAEQAPLTREDEGSTPSGPTCGCRQAGRHQASTLTRAGSIPATAHWGVAQRWSDRL